MSNVQSQVIYAALEQLKYVDRLLRGSQNQASVDDLLSSVTGNGPLSGAYDGLIDAPSSLLAPLVGDQRAANNVKYPTTLQGQFQPRRFLALAHELTTILPNGNGSETGGQTNDAVQLARQLSSSTEVQDQASTSTTSTSRNSTMRAQALLNERKRRFNFSSGDLKAVDDPFRPLEENMFLRGKPYEFPGQDTAHTLVPSATNANDRTTWSNLIHSLLEAWQATLVRVDAEAAASLRCTLHWLREHSFCLRMDIDQVGVALIWLKVDQGALEIERVNVLAESEIDAELQNKASATPSLSRMNDALHARPSTFPLYRQITAQLLTKVLTALQGPQMVEASDKASTALLILVNALCAVAGLCHLHDPFPTLALHSHQPPRGTAAVLSALSSWSVYSASRAATENEMRAAEADHVTHDDDKSNHNAFQTYCSTSSTGLNTVTAHPPQLLRKDNDSVSIVDGKGCHGVSSVSGFKEVLSTSAEEAEAIAQSCLKQYNALGKQSAKPGVRPDGRFEWTILSGVVIAWTRREKKEYRCISLATGVKSLPLTQLSPFGDILHDCHAEVLARRAARSWLLQRVLDEHAVLRLDAGECDMHQEIEGIPPIFRRSNSISEPQKPPWTLSTQFDFHLYSSTMPCGDLSSSMVGAGKEDNMQPFTDIGNGSETDKNADKISANVLRGRLSSASTQCSLRTKPGRPQSKPSISMSCSDKIALWTAVGFQGSLLTRWIGEIYFRTLVIGDQGARRVWQASEQPRKSDALQEHLSSASLRCSEMLRTKVGSVCQATPAVVFVPLRFSDGREDVEDRLVSLRPDAKISGPSDELDVVASAASLVWTSPSAVHCIVNGRKQGAPLKRLPGRALRASFRSAVCKLSWYESVAKAEKLLVDSVSQGYSDAQSNSDELQRPSEVETYYTAKHSALLAPIRRYREGKQMLRGTNMINEGDRTALEQRQVKAFLDQHSAHAAGHDIPVLSALQSVEAKDDTMKNLSILFSDKVNVEPHAMLDETSSTEHIRPHLHVAPMFGWLVAGSKFESFTARGEVQDRH